MSISLKIYTIEKKLYEGEADSVTLPGVDGELGVLATHIPLISSLKHGKIKIQRDKEKNPQYIDIRGGFVEIRPGSQVVILAN